MMTSVRVPIRTRPSVVSRRASFAGAPAATEAIPPVMDREAVTLDEPTTAHPEPDTQYATRNTRRAIRDTPEPEKHSQGVEEEETLEKWRDRALRLRAEMENFRKRQQRLADERIAADRERLLRAFLNVADDLERALNTNGTDAESLRQGVDLTYQSLMRILNQEGAKPIQAKGEFFDPAWHEAVSTVPYQQADAEPDTVVQVVQVGYRIGDHLLRPSRVIVAT